METNRTVRSPHFARWMCVPVLFSIGYAACGPEEATSSTGTLRLHLSTELSGVAYELRGARFDVMGPEDTILTEDGGAEAASLQVTLAEGDYQIELLDGWQLERRLSPASDFEPVESFLLSPNPTEFAIVDGQTTHVAFAFETTGTTVSFGEGNLNLTIRVVDNGSTSNQPSTGGDDPPVLDPAACDFGTTEGCEQLACETACPTNVGSFCLTACSRILTCVSSDVLCITAADPLCAQRTNGTPSACTSAVEQGGPATNPTSPSAIARAFIECLCSQPRP
jgi:hypothetical protein